jgi:hypothetical protein
MREFPSGPEPHRQAHREAEYKRAVLPELSSTQLLQSRGRPYKQPATPAAARADAYHPIRCRGLLRRQLTQHLLIQLVRGAVAWARSHFEAAAPQNRNVSAVVADQLALAQRAGRASDANPPHA